MKMKNSNGQGALLESSCLKALCHKHVPPDWREENDVSTRPPK
jgi:NuA3 HAT complex component NTO1